LKAEFIKRLLATSNVSNQGSNELMDANALFNLGIALVFTSLAILVIALFVLFFSNSKDKKMKGGGVVIIGFIPIVFGTDKESIKKILLLSLLLTIVLTVVLFLYYLVLR
jgi:uncharacterized protein (TIGR00304 family)